jgi:hypothetical protein
MLGLWKLALLVKYNRSSLPECGFFSVAGVSTTTSYLSLSHHLSFVLGLPGWKGFSCIWWGRFRRWAWFLHPRLAHFCKFHSSHHCLALLLLTICNINSYDRLHTTFIQWKQRSINAASMDCSLQSDNTGLVKYQTISYTPKQPNSRYHIISSSDRRSLILGTHKIKQDTYGTTF